MDPSIIIGSPSKLRFSLSALMAEVDAHLPEQTCALNDLAEGFKRTPDELSKPVLSSLANAATCMFTHFTNHVTWNAFKTWISHVKSQLGKGGGSLFAYVSKQDKTHLNVNVSSLGGDDYSPDRFLDKQRAEWSGLWAPDPTGNEHANVAVVMSLLQKYALEHPAQEFEPTHFRKSIKTYSKDTKGCDTWTAKILKSLPDAPLSEISDALSLSKKMVAQPHQNLMSLNACLGKPNNSIRTVSKTPMLYRMSCRCDLSVKHWEEANRQEYDSACKGSSAITSALIRNLQAEVAHWLGKQSAAVFNDYHKFFDTIDIDRLIYEAISTGFPPVELSLALQQHLAPRIIQASGYCSNPTQVYKSILAGCKHFVSITRTLLLNLMKKLILTLPEAKPRVHVDDTSMLSVGDTTSEVQDKLVPCILGIAKGVSALRLTLSKKGVICSSDNKLTLRIQKELANHSIQYNTSKNARDLGIAYTSAKKTPNQILVVRLKSVRKRILKISSIAKVDRKARILFSGSAYSAATYGHAACGITPSQLLQLEIQAANCTGITRAGRCRTLALVVAYGRYSTPSARMILETITAWIATVRRFLQTSTADDLRNAWIKARSEIIIARKEKPVSMAGTRGIMSNVISMLLNLRWEPVSFNVWRDIVTGSWVLDDWSVAPHIVAQGLSDSDLNLKLQKASEHYNGKGIENGIDWEISLNLTRALNKPAQYNHKCTIDTIM